MPRLKTLPDQDVLDAAMVLMLQHGPEALTFARLATACGLSPATLVQRFGTKARLKQAALLQAWDQLMETTTRLAATMPNTPEGAIELLVGFSQDYGGIEAYADGLLLLREDLRDPLLRARGAAWEKALNQALGERFASVPYVPDDIGSLMAAQWQGALLWWSFDPKQRVDAYVEQRLRRFVEVVMAGAWRTGPMTESER